MRKLFLVVPLLLGLSACGALTENKDSIILNAQEVNDAQLELSVNAVCGSSAGSIARIENEDLKSAVIELCELVNNPVQQ